MVPNREKQGNMAQEKKALTSNSYQIVGQCRELKSTNSGNCFTFFLVSFANF